MEKKNRTSVLVGLVAAATIFATIGTPVRTFQNVGHSIDGQFVNTGGTTFQVVAPSIDGSEPPRPSLELSEVGDLELVLDARHTDWGGREEHWFTSKRNGRWYFLTPDNGLHSWNRSSRKPVGGELLGTTGFRFYNCPDTLPIVSRQLTHIPRHRNWGERNEHWFRSPNGRWYYLLYSGEFFEWDRTRRKPVRGRKIAELGRSYYLFPQFLPGMELGLHCLLPADFQ